jgi:hypothetical protein
LYKRWDKLNEEQQEQLLDTFKVSEELKKLYFLKNELAAIFDSRISKTDALHACNA